MLNRKGAVTLALAAAVATTAQVALAETAPSLTLSEPTVVTMADAPVQRGALMNGLDRLGAASTLDRYGINVYGWVEGGYTYNHRHTSKESSVTPDAPKVYGGTFNHEAGDNLMFNQLDLRIEKVVDTHKFDVGGLIEVMYGQDAAGIHANGLEYGNSGIEDRFHPQYQFDIPQAYVDVAPGLPGLFFRAGKFVTLMGYETINPNQNAFYSHSYIFSSLPLTHVGVLAFYNINEQFRVVGGITRGWDQATEDNNGSPDFLGQVGWTPNKQLGAYLNLSVGPQNTDETAHYRTSINPVINWAVTDVLSLGADGLYTYDGGYNAGSYGDVWGLALYAGYRINEYATANARIEKFHDYRFGTTLNFYEATLGVTIKPFPRDPWGSGLKIRPEVRYDYSEDKVYPASGSAWRDQFTFGADIIYAF